MIIEGMLIIYNKNHVTHLQKTCYPSTEDMLPIYRSYVNYQITKIILTIYRDHVNYQITKNMLTIRLQELCHISDYRNYVTIILQRTYHITNIIYHTTNIIYHTTSGRDHVLYQITKMMSHTKASNYIRLTITIQKSCKLSQYRNHTYHTYHLL